jgi:sugar lactone lactonase YvrE
LDEIIQDIVSDVDGNLYVPTYGSIYRKGPIFKVSPEGKILDEYEICVNPGKICFGGPDGRTAYVIDYESKSLVKFRVDRPGAEWQRLQPE